MPTAPVDTCDETSPDSSSESHTAGRKSGPIASTLVRLYCEIERRTSCVRPPAVASGCEKRMNCICPQPTLGSYETVVVPGSTRPHGSTGYLTVSYCGRFGLIAPFMMSRIEKDTTSLP